MFVRLCLNKDESVTPIGKAPTDAEIAEALPRLNTFIAWLFGTKLGEFVSDWPVPPQRTAPVPADTALPSTVCPYPPNNARLLIGIDEATTVYLPFRPNPGARLGLADVGSSAPITINANGRLIEGAAEITLTASEATPREWFYREELATWVRVANLGLEDESPLSFEFDDLLITALAKRLAPRFGSEVLVSTQETYAVSLSRLEKKYQQYMPENGNYDPVNQTRQAYNNGFYGDEGALYRG